MSIENLNNLNNRLNLWEKQFEKTPIPVPFKVIFSRRGRNSISFKKGNDWPVHLISLVNQLESKRISKKIKLEMCANYSAMAHCRKKIYRIFHAQSKDIIEAYLSWVAEYGR